MKAYHTKGEWKLRQMVTRFINLHLLTFVEKIGLTSLTFVQKARPHLLKISIICLPSLIGHLLYRILGVFVIAFVKVLEDKSEVFAIVAVHKLCVGGFAVVGIQ